VRNRPRAKFPLVALKENVATPEEKMALGQSIYYTWKA